MTDRPAFLQPNLIERFLNRFVGVLVGWGLGPSYNYVLQVRGRKSGRTYSTPVNVLDFRGKRFIVATRGETQWVRNARVDGEVWLKRGNTRERFGLRLLSDAEKPEVLREYLNRFKTTARRFFSVPPGAPLEAFSTIARYHPVFELLRQ